MDDDSVMQDELPGVVPVGERLREAREARKLSVEDLATSTRIPKRHLQSLEASDWEKLPAPTYTMGFAKSYAAAVGLDKEEVAAQLREELGGFRPVQHDIEGYEVSDPKRAMPRWLLVAAVLAVIAAIVLFSWLNDRRLAGEDVRADEVLEAATADPQTASLQQADNVLIIANEPVDVRIVNGSEVLYEGRLASGESFVVPADAAAPMLDASDPAALRIAVGTADAPAIGPSGSPVSGVSLLGTDLLAGPQAQAAPSTTPSPAPATTQRAPVRPAANSPSPTRSTPPPAPARPATQQGSTTPPSATATRPANSPTSSQSDTSPPAAPPPSPSQGASDTAGE
ncbi:helix-turn-helix domain-containing protein [Sphingomicrobium nitratireducens]|uniref:helix-turn-helix domain-containing protein n=1 Tax=Sphingomicrobium nitratireducens TaxID=2964666 RepID=UPI00223E98B1|nr:helix-turn-helix domain-containing protein [Sphingomicrobium nitratireducens]